jgi:methylphosphotriester-DNA--protein-cysteine methyltransferase
MGWSMDEQAAFAVKAGYRPCRRLFKRRMAVVGSQDGGVLAVATAWAVRPLRWSNR